MKMTDIGTAAAQATDSEFSSQISGLVNLTDDQKKDLFPTQDDKDQLQKLIDAITKSADDNERTAKIVDGIGQFGGTIVKLLKTTAIPVT